MTTTAVSGTPVTDRRRAWTVVAMLLAFMLINFMDKAVLGLAGGALTAELHLTATEFGAIGSAFYLLFSVSGIVVGGLATRIDSRWILTGMMIGWSVSQLPMLIPAAGAGVLFLTRITLGAAEGPAYAISNHAAFTWFPDRERNLPASVLTLGAGLGVTIGVPILTVIITEYGWRWAFGFTAVTGLVWLVLWLRLGGEGPYGVRGGASAGPRVPYRKLLLNGTVVGGTLATFTVYWTLALSLTWFPQYLQQVKGYSLTEVGLLSVVWHTAGLAVILGTGFLTQRFLRRGVSSRVARGLVAGGAVATGGVAMVAMTLVDDAVPHLLLLTLSASAGYIAFPLTQAGNAELTPDAQRSAVLGTTTAIATAAGAVAPVLTGAVVQRAADAATGFGAAFTIAGLLMVIGGVVAALTVNPERDKKKINGGVA
ncbi:MFS transporter [Streptosporangium sp. NPDC000396]|uniref:MFS transporter n=1 Tax=Streptosporangium sp. NPDC000396 TaxID=3366185 RepID=UPI00369E8B3E